MSRKENTHRFVSRKQSIPRSVPCSVTLAHRLLTGQMTALAPTSLNRMRLLSSMASAMMSADE